MNMSADQWWKAGGYAGIVFVVLFVIGVVLQFDGPRPDASGDEIKQYFIDDSVKYIIGDFVIGIGFVFFFLTFIWALSALMRTAEPPGQTWSTMILVYGAVFTAAGAALTAFYGALAYGAAVFLDANTARAMVYAYYYGSTLGGSLLIAAIIFSVGVAILRNGVFWSWLGYFSLALAAALVVSSLGVLAEDPEGPLGMLSLVCFLLWGVWTLIVSYGMITRDAVAAVVVEERVLT